MPRTKLRQGQTQTSKEEGGSTARTTAQIEKYYSGGKREFTYKKNDRGKVIKVELKGGGMSSGQAAIAAKAPPPNKIDAKDFAVLRAEKAKGRGMGLQDESVQPGKVMKAKQGKMMKYKRGSGLDLPVINSVKPGSKIGKGKKKFKSMTEMRKAKGFKPGESASEFMKRRKELAGAAKAVSATRIGKIALGVVTAGIGAKKYLESKMNKKKDVKKKMGGGMMQRPMGYTKGGGADMGSSRYKAFKTTQDVLKTLKDSTDLTSTQKQMLTYAKGKAFKNKGTRLTDRDIEKARSLVKGKMGGGMMQKPMGYKHGTSVKVKCKLGRNKPTKIT